MKKCCAVKVIARYGFSRNDPRQGKAHSVRSIKRARAQRTCEENVDGAVEKICIRQIEKRQKPAFGQLKDTRMKPL